jgi:hypothetical protein
MGFPAIAFFVVLVVATFQSVPHTGAKAEAVHPKITIDVRDFNTGEPIRRGETLTEITDFQVTITTAGVDCAGQFVVTALGAPGVPPSVVVQAVAFVIGPAVGSNSLSGSPLDSGLQNDWKITASCNGAERLQRDFDFFEFFAEVP